MMASEESKRGRGRPRRHVDAAARQRAYRERKRKAASTAATKRLWVLEHQGKIIIQLDIASWGPCFRLFNLDGECVISLQARSTGGVVTLGNHAKPMAVLMNTPDGVGLWSGEDAPRLRRVTLAPEREGTVPDPTPGG